MSAKPMTVGEVQAALTAYMQAITGAAHTTPGKHPELHYFEANVARIQELLSMDAAVDPEAIAFTQTGQAVYSVLSSPMGLCMGVADPDGSTDYMAITVLCTPCLIESRNPMDWQEYKLGPEAGVQ